MSGPMFVLLIIAVGIVFLELYFQSREDAKKSFLVYLMLISLVVLVIILIAHRINSNVETSMISTFAEKATGFL